MRDAARDTLVRMAAALGESFLPYIIKEMKDLLTRGYQVRNTQEVFFCLFVFELFTFGFLLKLHVLAYSLHSILNGLHSILKTGDLDPCLDLISQVLHQFSIHSSSPTLLFSILSFQILVEDLFGVPAEEREAGESVAKIPESKSPQSYNSYCLVAQFLSPDQVPQLLAPIKEVRGINQVWVEDS